MGSKRKEDAGMKDIFTYYELYQAFSLLGAGLWMYLIVFKIILTIRGCNWQGLGAYLGLRLRSVWHMEKAN